MTLAVKTVIANGEGATRTAFDAIMLDHLEAFITAELPSIVGACKLEGARRKHAQAPKTAVLECEPNQEKEKASKEFVEVPRASFQAVPSQADSSFRARCSRQLARRKRCRDAEEEIDADAWSALPILVDEDALKDNWVELGHRIHGNGRYGHYKN
jgi:hypothetical protein